MQNISLSVDPNAGQFDIALDGQPLLSGFRDIEARWRGRILKPLDAWSKTCEYHENGCDYYELDMPLTRDYRLQRFFLLDREDRLFILGDALLRDGGVTSAKIPLLEYEAALAVSPAVSVRKNSETAKGSLKNRAPGRVFPLQGDLRITDGMLVYRLKSDGISLFAPLVFDLDAARCRKPFLLRQLTVGENMEKVPDDRAVGFRFQLDKRQFLLYRSMTPPANRTVLGHNLIDDFCFARFDPKTGVEPLVEVQQEP